MKKKPVKRKYSIVGADFWDIIAGEIVRDQHKKRLINLDLIIKKTLFIQDETDTYYARKGKILNNELSRIWNRVRPPKGGDSGGLWLITVGETRPTKRRKPVKRFSKTREKQIIKGKVRPVYGRGKIVGLRAKNGQFISFK